MRNNMFSFGLSSSDEDTGRQPSACDTTCSSLKGASQSTDRACNAIKKLMRRHLPCLQHAASSSTLRLSV